MNISRAGPISLNFGCFLTRRRRYMPECRTQGEDELHKPI
jgi:hypothetical protein